MPNFSEGSSPSLPWVPSRLTQEVTEYLPARRFQLFWNFQTLVIEIPRYIPQLIDEFKSHGGNLVLGRKLLKPDELGLLGADVIVNCTGLGSAVLFNDGHLHGDKGILILHEPIDGIQALGADIYTMIPRSDCLVLGTHYLVPPHLAKSMHRDPYYSEEPTSDEIETILSGLTQIVNDPGCPKTAAAVPTFGAVKDVVARFRPRRDGGIRLELDTSGPIPIIHNYGHGGSGVCLSWGCAYDVLGNVDEVAGKLKSQPAHLALDGPLISRQRVRLWLNDPLYFQSNRYDANPTTPFHRWFTIPESNDLDQVRNQLATLDVVPGDTIIDPFVGSGTSALAALHEGASFVGIDVLASCVLGTASKLYGPRLSAAEVVAGSEVLQRMAGTWRMQDAHLLNSEGSTAQLELSGLFANPGPASFMQVIQPIVKTLGTRQGKRDAVRGTSGRRHRVHLSAQQTDDLVAEYQSGTTTKEIAAIYGIHHTTVSIYLKRKGVALRYKVMSPKQVTEARDLYESGLSLAKISDQLGLGPSHNTIRRELMAEGVKMRDEHGRPRS